MRVYQCGDCGRTIEVFATHPDAAQFRPCPSCEAVNWYEIGGNGEQPPEPVEPESGLMTALAVVFHILPVLTLVVALTLLIVSLDRCVRSDPDPTGADIDCAADQTIEFVLPEFSDSIEAGHFICASDEPPQQD